jgi:hypothetical protein
MSFGVELYLPCGASFKDYYAKWTKRYETHHNRETPVTFLYLQEDYLKVLKGSFK